MVPNGRGYKVECYPAEPSPPNSITEKSIVDADAVGEAVRRAVKRASTKVSEVAIAISGDAAITKVIQMPRHLNDNDMGDYQVFLPKNQGQLDDLIQILTKDEQPELFD